MGRRAIEKVKRDVRHILRLDDDLSAFYAAVAAHPEFEWIARQGAGRLLRSPTVFEDLVKMICTTNCSWALTDKMVRGLVDNLGDESSSGERSFPSPETMAGQRLGFYRNVVRAGYRAPYLKELAQRAASGDLDVERWLDPAIPADQVKREMKQVKGVGDYAAENLLKLVGRYDGLALDSWTRATFARIRNRGRKATDRKIERFYSAFNSWRGLAIWCDLTRHWLEEAQAVKAGD
jgi:N-glycosylase/DNA lyase